MVGIGSCAGHLGPTDLPPIVGHKSAHTGVDLVLHLLDPEQVRGNQAGFGQNFVGRHQNGRAGNDHGARAKSACAIRHPAGVALDQLNAIERHTQGGGQQLRKGGDMGLAMAVRAAQHHQAAVGRHADFGRVKKARAGPKGARIAGWRHARAFYKVANPKAAQQAPLLRGLPPLGKAGVVCQHQRLVKQAHKVAAVINRPQRCGVGHVLPADKVFAPQLKAVHAGLHSGRFHQPLEHKAGLGPPGAAVGVGGHGVGEHGVHLGKNGRDFVGARHHGRVHRGGHSRPHGGDISAQGGMREHAQAQDVALCVQRHLGVGAVVAGLVVADKGLAAGGHPFERLPQLQAGPGQDGFFRVELAFGAKAAAHVGGNHADGTLAQTELL